MVQQNNGSLARPDVEAYLAVVEELTSELMRARTAVTTGNLPDFEDSLVRQRTYGVRLAELQERYAARAADPTTMEAMAADPTLADRLRLANGSLDVAIRQYTRLLKHFGQTARLFAGMFRGYGTAAGMAVSGQKTASSWSCYL